MDPPPAPGPWNQQTKKSRRDTDPYTARKRSLSSKSNHAVIMSTGRDNTESNNHIGAKLDNMLGMLEKIAKSKICERLTSVELEMKKMNEFLCRNLEKEEAYNDQKPECLPLRTTEEVDSFGNSSTEYKSVVMYFCYLGGNNLKQATSICFREAICDSLLASYTWFGTDACQPLYKTKIVQAIYDAACKSKTFPKPTRWDFQESMRVVLRTAKERFRCKDKRQRRERAHTTTAATATRTTEYWGQENQEDV
ncbi:uncharacterized protein LOC117228315 isoform X2 [Megalopta genalis]|uniref:uncharacterized protein LOC117228315 isoform X2 n=1 Tax=Megalopta genalis TaxID=115081 RepID=UPI003FD3BF7D